jgi:phosphate transport system substrate-binding protein
MSFVKQVLFCAGLACLLHSCKEGPKITDTLGKGKIDISADEAYKPILDAEKKVFDSSYPEANITIHYKPEAECMRDYFDNKARIVLISRDLSKEEKDLCGRKQIYNTSLAVALDAVAVIVNNSSPDSEMDMTLLRGVLKGESKIKYTVVFDNKTSGMVNFITDSVMGGEHLGNNVFAVNGDSAVIDYVARNPGAVGFVGLSYVCDPEDATNTGTFINKVRVVALENKPNPTIDNSGLRRFNKPYQAIIARQAYPLTRKMFYINRESYPGLGTGFANFLAKEQGQLIFAHAHLFPLRMSIVIREASIKN